MPGGVAEREIAATLAQGRYRFERAVSRYRLVMYLVAFASTAATGMLVRPAPIFPILYFAAGFLCALLLWWVVRRWPQFTAIASLSFLFDLVALNGLIPLIRILMDLGLLEGVTVEENERFAMVIGGVSTIAVLSLHLLRGDRRSWVVGAAASIPIYLIATLVSVPYSEPIVVVTVILVGVGVIGFFAANLNRSNLEDLARRQLLARYLPEAAVQRVLEHADADDALAPGGRLAEVTLVATDLRGFTAMSQRLSPADVVDQLNGYHGRMLDVIDRHGGTLDKFIGDGALAVFGLTSTGEAGPEAAAAAVACAREMLDALARLNTERASAGREPLRMGIAVHSGPVIAGNIGAPHRRLEFTVIGDTVNAVSRLESLTKEMGTPLLVSGETVSRLATDHGLSRLGSRPLRGRTGEMEIYGLS